MPSTPRFHRRKNSRTGTSSCSWFTTLRSRGTPTRKTTPTRDYTDSVEASLPSLLQQPVLFENNPPSLSSSSTLPPLFPKQEPEVDPSSSWADPEQLFSSPDDDSIYSASSAPSVLRLLFEGITIHAMGLRSTSNNIDQ
jgi:hypothetical protein